MRENGVTRVSCKAFPTDKQIVKCLHQLRFLVQSVQIFSDNIHQTTFTDYSHSPQTIHVQARLIRIHHTTFTGSSNLSPPDHIQRQVSFVSTSPQARLILIHQSTSTGSSHSHTPAHAHRLVSFAYTSPHSQTHLIRILQTTSTVSFHSHPLFVNRKLHSDGFPPKRIGTPWKRLPSGCLTDHYCINVNFLVRDALKDIPSIRQRGKARKYIEIEDKDNILNLNTVKITLLPRNVQGI